MKRKLKLKREQIRVLGSLQLSWVAGGVRDTDTCRTLEGGSGCWTCWPKPGCVIP